MDPVVTVAIIGVATTVASVIATAWSSRGQIGIKALELATSTYQADNAELRTRVFAAEQHVVDLTAQVNRCESDKAQLARRVDELTRRLDDNLP
jgi:hypothetical protein